MAEFTDTLNAPGDYQRPVGGKAQGPDIFGTAAKLLDDIGNLGKGRGGNSTPSLTEQRNLLEDVGLDLVSRGAAQIMTGRKSGEEDILAMFGADAQSAFQEMKRLDSAFKEGEMTPQVREVMLERLVTGVMGAYPEASYEIMGQALSQLGVDHAFARNYKYTLAQQDQAEKDKIARDAHYYDLATKAGYGYDLTTGKERTRGEMVTQGMIIAHTATMDAETKKTAETAKALAEAERLGNKATADSLKLHQKTQSFELGTKAIQIASLNVGDWVAKLSALVPTAGADPTKNEAFIQVVQKAKSDMLFAKQAMETKLTEGKVLKEDMDRVSSWFKDQNDALDGLLNGSAANAVALPKMWDMIAKSGAVEASQVAPVYKRAVDVFGQGFVSDLLNLRVPGIGPNETLALRNDILQGLSSGMLSTEAAKDKVRTAQSALAGANIPQEADPKKRLDLLNWAGFGLSQVLPKFSGKGDKAPTDKDLNNFNGATVTMLSAASADSPTIELDNVKKVNFFLFSQKWRDAALQFEMTGGDGDKAKNMMNYNVVVAAKILDTVKNKYVNSGKIEFDPKTQRFVPTASKVLVWQSTGLGGGHAVSKPGAPTQEQKDAATEANLLIDHLEAMSTMIEVVPESALKKEDALGKEQELSVRQVFATDANLSKSIENFFSNMSSDKLPSSDDKFWESIKAFGEMDVQQKLDLSSMDDLMVKGRIESVSIRANASGYARPTDVPVTDLQSHMVKVNARENGSKRDANPHYKLPDGSPDPNKTASGSYGFTLDTWASNLDKVAARGIQIPGYSKDMPKKEKFKLMKDPVLEDEVMKEFTLGNIAYLRKSLGRNVSWEEVDMAHVFGASGAAKFIAALEQNPNTKASKVMDPDSYNSNKGGLTKGDPTVLQVWNRRTGRDDGTFQTYMNDSGYVGSYEAPVINYLADVDDIELPSQP